MHQTIRGKASQAAGNNAIRFCEAVTKSPRQYLGCRGNNTLKLEILPRHLITIPLLIFFKS